LEYLKRLDRYWNKPRHAAYLFVMPAMLIVLLFSIVPLISSFGISLFEINTSLSNPIFVGFDNYSLALRDVRFLNALKNTLLFTLFDVPLQVIVALVIAALLPGKSFMDKLMRAVFFLPIVCSPTAIGIMWQIFLNPNVGWFPYMLTQLGLPKISFFKDMHIALYSIMFVSVWRSFGMSMTILVAAMQGVPQSLYEASRIDGAGKLKQFFNVTLPGISGTLWFVLITRIIGSLQVFDIVYTITGGGPAYSTETLVSYVYARAFEQSSRLGYATAMAEWLFLLIMLITVVLYTRMNKQEALDI